MPLISCPECSAEVSGSAESCPHCGFGLRDYFEEAAESSMFFLTLAPPLAYFSVVLGGIHLGYLESTHAFFNSALFDIPVFTWLWLPIFWILGGVPVVKNALWGGWSGAIFFSVAIIYLVKFIAPELSPF